MCIVSTGQWVYVLIKGLFLLVGLLFHYIVAQVKSEVHGFSRSNVCVMT